MRIESGDGRIRLYPEGALNSVNASELEKEIFAALKAEPGAEVEADCEKLTSISSVGLRLMLKIHRETGGWESLRKPWIPWRSEQIRIQRISDLSSRIRKRWAGYSA